jgi:hypothetical protein
MRLAESTESVPGSIAGVAQSAERLTRNEQVRGSIPLPGSERSEVAGGARISGRGDENHAPPSIPLPGSITELVVGLRH